MNVDILGLGCLAWDKFLFVERSAQTDSKMPIVRQAEQVGGTGGSALRAAARYGAKAAWAGIVGTDGISQRALAALIADGVDVSLAKQDASSSVIQTWIVVDVRRQARTVYYDLGCVIPCSETFPADEAITSAKVLLVDTFGIDGAIRAANLAQRNKIPVVADCEVAEAGGLAEFLDAADHLILPHAIAAEITAAQDPAAAVSRLWNDSREAVIVTCGEGGAWYRGKTMHAAVVHHFPAFYVDVVDTTGCGDVFHGVYAAALAAGLSLEDRLLHASAAAAMKAMHYPGESLPTREEIEAFLRSREV
jgi:sulfofructose kinase